MPSPPPRSAAALAIDDAKMYARFLWGLRGFLQERIGVEQARAIVRQRLRERDARFMRMAERGIYGHPRSPYLPLLRMAGCELGDLQAMLRDKGLEPTLLALRQAGVYVNFEEFKGRTPIVRGSTVVPVQARDFDNPYLRRAYESASGGTTGSGTRVDIDLDHLAEMTPYAVLSWETHGFYGAPNGLWYGAPPDGTGLGVILNRTRGGMMPIRWFTPFSNRDMRPPVKYRVAGSLTVAMARAYGAPFPRPEPLPIEQAVVVALWMHRMVRAYGSCAFGAPVSLIVRICAAAVQDGIDLRGSAFMGAGEPPTAAKVRTIRASGAHWLSMYGSQETGTLGISCGNPLDGNDLHFVKDGFAMLQHDRVVPGSDVTVPAFNFTSLLPAASKLLLNTEIDDFGLVESRDCGCPLQELGLTEHLREIYSYSKLTSEGVTLVGSDMVRILEEVLPARFGGGPLDYQLLEEEDAKGFTRLSLLISPRVAIADEAAVVEHVFESLRRTDMGANVARAMWSQAGSPRVQRREPIWSGRGKLMPLRLAQRAADSDARP